MSACIIEFIKRLSEKDKMQGYIEHLISFPPMEFKKWAASWQNQQYGCAPSKDRSAWASAQSDQSLCCQHEERLGP